MLGYAKWILEKHAFNLEKVSLHVVYESAKMADILITNLDFKRRTGKMLDMRLLRKIREMYKELGYERRHMNLKKVAKFLTNRHTFPVEIITTFLNLIDEVIEHDLPHGDTKLVIASCMLLAADIQRYKITLANIRKVIFKTKRTTMVEMEEMKKYIEIMKKSLI